eukprot:Rmarinus@m.23922
MAGDPSMEYLNNPFYMSSPLYNPILQHQLYEPPEKPKDGWKCNLANPDICWIRDSKNPGYAGDEALPHMTRFAYRHTDPMEPKNLDCNLNDPSQCNFREPPNQCYPPDPNQPKHTKREPLVRGTRDPPVDDMIPCHEHHTHGKEFAERCNSSVRSSSFSYTNYPTNQIYKTTFKPPEPWMLKLLKDS